MKPKVIPKSLKQLLALAGQLYLSHFVAIWLVLFILTELLHFFSVASPVLLCFAGLGAIVGLLLTLNIQRSLGQSTSTLARLIHTQSVVPLSPRWHWPLSHLVSQINTLVNYQQQTGELRETLLRQTGQAAAQEERNRLARDLHDSIKQQLFSLQVSAAAVQARWEQDPDGAKTALADVRQRAQEALVEMNAMLQQLSPAPLAKVGLVQALRDQCEALGYRTGAQILIEIGELPDDSRLPVGAQETLFRIAQEGLSNIARHARAARVWLRLQSDETTDSLTLELEDDGQGFEIKQASTGMGLSNIRQRVQAMGGTLALSSRLGQGTTLGVHIPLLEPSEVEVELIYQRDPTARRVMLSGLAGGLALIAALFYPLYVLLPGLFVADWLEGSAVLGLISQVVAAAMTVATGYLAARWVGVSYRPKGIILGALAGGLAGTVLFLGLGGAAAGVIGASPIAAHGLVSITDEFELDRLVIESFLGIAWWSYSMFWVMLLAGGGLGALGGMLAPMTVVKSDSNNSIKMLVEPEGLDTVLAFCGTSALTFFLTLPLSTIYEETMLNNMAKLETPFRLTIFGLSGLPASWGIANLTTPAILSNLSLITIAIFYLASFTALLIWLWVKSRTEDPTLLRQMSDRASVLTAVSLLLAWSTYNPLKPVQLTSEWIGLNSMLINLVLGALAFALAWKIDGKQKARSSISQRLDRFYKFPLSSQVWLNLEAIIVAGVISATLLGLIALGGGAKEIADYLIISGLGLFGLLIIIIILRLILMARIQIQAAATSSVVSRTRRQLHLSSGRGEWLGSILIAVILVIAPMISFGPLIVNFYQPGWYQIFTVIDPSSPYRTESFTSAEVTLTDFVQSLYLTQVQILVWAILMAILILGLFLIAKTGFGYFKQGISYLAAQFQQEQYE